ncbi:MAG: sugar transferase [Clostridia bacterium]|nr:sugar transferase [Clostridia bacterium]
MRNEKVREYYDFLKKKKLSLFIKRAFDLFASSVALIILSPIFAVLAIMIKLDSPGPVFFRQERVTQYGKRFYIHKFRTMFHDSEGSQITVGQDNRITRVGNLIRSSRLDETAQLIDVVCGHMTLVGVRPEVPQFIEYYTDEMMATLMLPAGVTSLASIYYKDEGQMLDDVEDVDKVYGERILPQKMYYNLKGMKSFSFLSDIGIIFKTIFAILGKEYSDDSYEKDVQVHN